MPGAQGCRPPARLRCLGRKRCRVLLPRRSRPLPCGRARVLPRCLSCRGSVAPAPRAPELCVLFWGRGWDLPRLRREPVGRSVIPLSSELEQNLLRRHASSPVKSSWKQEDFCGCRKGPRWDLLQPGGPGAMLVPTRSSSGIIRWFSCRSALLWRKERAAPSVPQSKS